MCEKLLHKDVKLTKKIYPLNLISMLKSKISLSIFTPFSFNFNADFQKINAEIPFTSSYLELWNCQQFLNGDRMCDFKLAFLHIESF